jgi:hypothetical protein
VRSESAKPIQPGAAANKAAKKPYTLFSPRNAAFTAKEKMQTKDLRIPDSKSRPSEHSNYLHASLGRQVCCIYMLESFFNFYLR